jgi:hypothetical protein
LQIISIENQFEHENQINAMPDRESEHDGVERNEAAGEEIIEGDGVERSEAAGEEKIENK